MVITDQRRCSRCGDEKALDEFYVRSDLKHLRLSACKQCVRAERRRHYAANRDRLKAYQRERYTTEAQRATCLKRYGMTPADFEALLESQGGRCAICRTDDPGRRKSFHVDHDHETGAVRGLLCTKCNVALGGFRDDPALLIEAWAYLVYSSSKE